MSRGNITILSHSDLVSCELAKGRRLCAIYRAQTANIIQWAHEVYHYNCQLEVDNLLTGRVKNLTDHLKIINITPCFKNYMNPETN